MASLWLINPTQLAPPSGTGSRRLRKRGDPLIDLVALKQAISDDALERDDVWLATDDCEKNVQDLTWTANDILDCLVCLRPEDHKNSEWCKDRHGNWHACDAYAIRYDDAAKRRVRYSDINYYLKFSLDEDGALTLVLISCHL